MHLKVKSLVVQNNSEIIPGQDLKILNNKGPKTVP